MVIEQRFAPDMTGRPACARSRTQRLRCSALLKLPFPIQCSRRASLERGGQFYCGLHDLQKPRQITQRKE